MIRLGRIVHAAATTVTVAAVMTAAVGCGPNTTRKTEGGSASAPTKSLTIPFSLPPPINEGTLLSASVSRLRPGAPIMVGDNTAKVCVAGFYIDYPAPDQPGRHLPGFLTAAQCAQGNHHAPVAVMKVDAAGQKPQRLQIGEVTYLSAGDQNPEVADEPWTLPTSPLAVFSSGKPTWPITIDVTVNNKVPTTEILQTAQPAQQRKARATWTDSFGAVVTGHVLDPASTPELRDIPARIQRVVISADDAASPIYPQVLGSPVTVELDSGTVNLGIIVGTDKTRHWVVADLISPFLTAHGAHLATTS